jgi:uncharacterized protein YqgC (DUF456 family)
MIYLWASLLTLLNAGWLLALVIGLPGTWLMLLTTGLLAWWQWDAPGGPMFAPGVLVAVFVLAILGEVVEFGAGLAGSKHAGGTRWGAVGALVGTVVGGIAGTVLIPLPFIGSLIGACLGAAAGASGLELYTGRAMRPALQSGVGAGLGRLGGTLGKLAIGLAMWLTIAVAAFWP